MKHLRRWGAVYLLAVLFAGSWIAQAITMQATIAQDGWSEFWASTTENWQSEFLQLVIQAVFLLGAKHLIFQADAEDLERIEAKIDALRGHSGSDEDIARAFHEAYERLAPMHGYQTRTESAVPWDRVPGDNRRLMVATVRALREQGVIR